MTGVAALLLPALLGCGGGGREGESFKREYRQQSAALTRLGSDIGDAVVGAGGRSNSVFAREFGRLASRMRATVEKLEGLEPPDDVKSAFEALKSALRRQQRDLRDVASAARTGDQTKAAIAARALVVDSQAIADARSRVDRALK